MMKRGNPMKIEIDTHTHTVSSGHAYSTMREMAQAAAEKGLKGLAVTDHSPDMPGSTHIYHFQNLRVVPRQMCGIELLLGAELNIRNASGEVDLPQPLLKALDITIASMHSYCYVDEAVEEKVTSGYLCAMENPFVDIIGHPDDSRYPVDYERLVKKAKETGTLLEVNNSSLKPASFRVNTKDNIFEMLSLCRQYKAAIVLGTDSHVDAAVGDYTYAEAALKEAEFPEELIANTSLEKLKSLLKRTKNR